MFVHMSQKTVTVSNSSYSCFGEATPRRPHPLAIWIGNFNKHMTLVTPPPSQRSLPKRSPFLAHPIQVFPNQAIPSSPPSTRGTTHHKACQSSNQNLLSSIVQQRIIQRLSINSKSKSNLDPQNELVDIQCVQYVLSIRILEYPLYLTITLSTHSHVQQTLQHSPLSQLQNQRTVLHTQPRQVVSTEVRVDQHTTREVDQSLL